MQGDVEPLGVLVHYTNIQSMSPERTTMLYDSAACRCGRNGIAPILAVTETWISSSDAQRAENKKKKCLNIINECYRLTHENRQYEYEIYCDNGRSKWGGAAICVPEGPGTGLTKECCYTFSQLKREDEQAHDHNGEPCSNGVAVHISLNNKCDFLLVCVYRNQNVHFDECAKDLLERALRKTPAKDGRKIPVVLVGDFNLPNITANGWRNFTRHLLTDDQLQASERYVDNTRLCQRPKSAEQFFDYLRALRDNNELTFRQYITRPTHTHDLYHESLLDLLLSTDNVSIKERYPITPGGTSVPDDFRVVFTENNIKYHYTILFSVSHKRNP